MTQDVRQWLAEIKSLQQKLTEAQQERDQARQSEASWRNLYETEARQRRTEAKLAKQKISALQSELSALTGDAVSLGAPLSSAENLSSDRLQQQIGELNSIEAVQNRLSEMLGEIDRLRQSLRSEQAAHQQTRVELTAALGDAIDRLTQERARNSSQPESLSDELSAVLPPAKGPSLELPQFE